MADIKTTFTEHNSIVKDAVRNKESNREGTASLAAESVDSLSKEVRSDLQMSFIESSIQTLAGSIRHKANSIHAAEGVINFYAVVTLVVIVCGMIGLYSCPIILYYTKQPTGNLFVIENTDFKSCLGNYSYAMIESNNLLEQCNIDIMDLPDCDINSTTILDLYLIYDLSFTLNNATQCGDALSFFCNATLLLCNGNSSPVDLTEECEEVRDNKCASEWRIAESYFNSSVPDCMSFTKSGNVTFTSAPNLPCANQFDHFCGSTCSPVCGEYSLLTEDTSTFYFRFVICVVGIICFISGIISLVACYYKRQNVFKFPQIYIVYNIVIFEIAILLQTLPFLMDRSVLMCSDRNFLVSIKEPTNFCQAQGFVLRAGFSWFFGFWMLHIFHLMFGLAFPFRNKHLMDSKLRRKQIYFTEMAIVILSGLISPVITLSVSNYQDNGWHCFPQSTIVLFYAEIVPGSLVFVIGLGLLCGSFWVLRRKHYLKHERSTVSKVVCLGYSTPEVKLSLMLCYYGVGVFFYLTYLVVFLRSTDDVTHYSNQYVYCSAGGDNDYCEMYRQTAAEKSTPQFVLSVISIISMSFVNFSHLVYIISFHSVKQFIQTVCLKKSVYL